MQLPASALLVFKAGVPAVRGRKIIWYRDPAFRPRLRPPPEIAPAPRSAPLPPPPAPGQPPAPSQPAQTAVLDPADADILRAFAAEGLPAPARGASEREVADWLDRVMAVDASPERRP
nr:hypothetical protein [Brevundimonas denitrificans]